MGKEIGVAPEVILETSHGRRSIDILKILAPEKANWECKSNRSRDLCPLPIATAVLGMQSEKQISWPSGPVWDSRVLRVLWMGRDSPASNRSPAAFVRCSLGRRLHVCALADTRKEGRAQGSMNGCSLLRLLNHEATCSLQKSFPLPGRPWDISDLPDKDS